MTLTAKPYDTRLCELGEGPLWHPKQNRLYWFDIIGKKLMSRDGDQPLEWQFDEHFSAAGWIDEGNLLLASETGLWKFSTVSGKKDRLCDLEAENPVTRSNDGRADPFGGFWIGTMGKQAQPRQGAIYRFFEGKIHKLYDGITVSNSICFAPDGSCAYFADTFSRKIVRQTLDSQGFPSGEPDVFVDLRPEESNPDGSVIDADGALWNAHWGKGRVVRYLPDGSADTVVYVGGKHSSCPAFGGDALQILYVTTAREGIENPDDDQGLLYAIELEQRGLPEHQVKL